MSWLAALPVVGSIVSSLMGQQEAEKNRNFQSDMSNTAHQREVTDLRAAGLNPILSAGGSGASTPTGGQGSISDLGQAMGTGINSATAKTAMEKELESKDSGIKNTDADTKNKVDTSSLIRNQIQSSAQEVKQKAMSNAILQKTLDAQIKKANAEGNYAEINQLMGVINSGASSAGQIVDMMSPVRKIIGNMPGKSKPNYNDLNKK